MPLNLPRPILYAITDGTTTSQTTPETLALNSEVPELNSEVPELNSDFDFVLDLTRTAVVRKIPLFQIREKKLSTLVLYDLVCLAVEITHGSETRLLVNDRFDVARAAGADGVHLTSTSLPARVVREVCGPDFLIGVS